MAASEPGGGERMAWQTSKDGRLGRFGTWVRAFSAFSTNSGDGNNPGFRSRTGGGAVGADYKISESFVIGISAG